jgi:hypothetical protein
MDGYVSLVKKITRTSFQNEASKRSLCRGRSAWADARFGSGCRFASDLAVASHFLGQIANYRQLKFLALVSLNHAQNPENE